MAILVLIVGFIAGYYLVTHNGKTGAAF